MGQVPPRFRRSRKRSIIVVAVLILLAGLRLWTGRDERAPDILDAGLHAVERVVDGDTLKLANGARVRLQGIDTPETVKEDHPVEAWGPEATEYTRQFVATADGRVRLEFDRERQDRFGRFLAFVWHEDRMLNVELVRLGLARATPGYVANSQRKRELIDAVEEARRQRRGIWSQK